VAAGIIFHTSISLVTVTMFVRCFPKISTSSFPDLDEFENRAAVASGTSDYHSTVARSRKRRKCFDESRDNEVVLQGRAKFRVTTFSVIIDQLSTALRHRIDACSQVRGTFKVITDFRELDHDSIRECSLSLATTYSNDLQPDMFSDEMVQFVEWTLPDQEAVIRLPPLQNCCTMKSCRTRSPTFLLHFACTCV